MCCWALAAGRGGLKGCFGVELHPAAHVQHAVHMVEFLFKKGERRKNNGEGSR